MSYEKLAREALEAHQAAADNGLHNNEPGASARYWAAISELCRHSPDLARAVLEQQAEIEHLRELMSCAAYTKLNSAYRAKEETYQETLGILTEVSKELHDKEKEIERLQSELRIEKASQATRGNA